MGLIVQLETEDGEPVEEAVPDPRNLLHRLLPSHDDSSYQCLRFIDWYGDTTFNNLQMQPLLAELERIQRVAQSSEEQELLARLKNLARRGQQEVHLYLKFYGD